MGFFGDTAQGLAHMPIFDFSPDLSKFENHDGMIKFSSMHYSLRGNFDKHYWASIPCIYEQECRLGYTLLEYSKSFNQHVHIWSMNSAEATFSRSIAHLSNGEISCVANTLNPFNKEHFYNVDRPKTANLVIVGDEEFIENSIEQKIYFDVIIEETSFQMKSKDRLSQLKRVKQVLKNSGILILVEKFNTDEYEYWEERKDRYFKRKYFSETDIEYKSKKIVTPMKNNQVTLNELRDYAKRLFQYGEVIWNAGNFYSIILTDCKDSFDKFIELLPPTCTDREYKSSQETWDQPW